MTTVEPLRRIVLLFRFLVGSALVRRLLIRVGARIPLRSA